MRFLFYNLLESNLQYVYITTDMKGIFHMKKTIHDIFSFGSTAVFNGQQYGLDDVMLLGTAETLYSVLGFTDDQGKGVVCGLNTQTNAPYQLSQKQIQLYHENLKLHKKRLMNDDSPKILTYKSNCTVDTYEELFFGVEKQNIERNIHTKLSICGKDYNISWYSLIARKQGDSLVVSIPEQEMAKGLAMQPLYNDIELSVSFPSYDLIYRGNVVMAERTNIGYILHIHPYPIEIMQSTQGKGATFRNIIDPFSIMDFVVNHADSGITKVVHPHSDKKAVHNYIIVGALKNIDIHIENCAIGNVRIGNEIDVSSEFKSAISDLNEEVTTFVWVNVESDSLYNAFSAGKKLLNVATEFLSFVIKNDMFADWFGTVGLDNKVWDVRSHYPQINLCTAYYIENCIMGESLTLTDENTKVPSAIRIDQSAEYLFDYDWIESFFCKLESANDKILRLRYALKWIVEAWNTEDAYDKVIYCSMALEFIVNGEKGHNIFDEYSVKITGGKFTKSERRVLIKKIVDNVRIEEIDGFDENSIEELNKSIKNMIQSKLTETSFTSKLDILITRLSIPVSEDEKALLRQARAIRNELIHGLGMSCISTLEIKNFVELQLES